MLELTTIRKRLVGNYADWFVQQKLFEFRMPTALPVFQSELPCRRHGSFCNFVGNIKCRNRSSIFSRIHHRNNIILGVSMQRGSQQAGRHSTLSEYRKFHY